MRQIQNQSAVQRLALSQQMRSSLSMLEMGPEELIEATEQEAKRNPFLRPITPAPTAGNTASTAAGSMTADLADESSHNADILSQVSLIRLNPKESFIAKELVYCLDERGYLADTAEEMSGYLDTPIPDLLKLVTTLQNSVEPAGIFAWSLKDSFRIQLVAKNRYDPLIARLLDRLDLVAHQNLEEICALCEVDMEDAADMLSDLRSLNPAPLHPVIPPDELSRAPELIFSVDEKQGVLVSLNECALPKMLADDALFSAVKAVEDDKYATAYYQDCYRGAAGIVIAMQKRANTLLKIGKILAREQQKFIQTGRILDRKPLTMGAVATELSLNKSTVSRALRNSLIETPRGVVSSIDLFARPLSENNEKRTRDQVLQRLSVLIRTEDKKAPFSDEELAQKLARANLEISRRTVAKYRGLIDIKGAYARRKIYMKERGGLRSQ